MWTATGCGIAAAIAFTGALRECFLPNWPLPQWNRQTFGWWPRAIGIGTSSALWGTELGLTFVTRLTFTGPLIIAGVIILSKDPAYGAGLLAAHWLGRALPVWILPLLVSSADPRDLMTAVNAKRRQFQLSHAMALVTAAAVVVGSAIGW